eukprot:750869-Hanusia_phi.AAC.1
MSCHACSPKIVFFMRSLVLTAKNPYSTEAEPRALICRCSFLLDLSLAERSEGGGAESFFLNPKNPPPRSERWHGCDAADGNICVFLDSWCGRWGMGSSRMEVDRGDGMEVGKADGREAAEDAVGELEEEKEEETCIPSHGQAAIIVATARIHNMVRRPNDTHPPCVPRGIIPHQRMKHQW